MTPVPILERVRLLERKTQWLEEDLDRLLKAKNKKALRKAKKKAQEARA